MAIEGRSRSIICQYYSVKAFVRGADNQGRRCRVNVAHQMINGGLSVPDLEPWFSAPYALKMIKLGDGNPKESWRAYFQAVPSATHLTPLSVEFALFCLNQETLRFVHVEKNSVYLDYVRLKYVSINLQRYRYA